MILAVIGLFFVGMAVLQAWPGRGFWQGQPNPHAAAGTLTGMVAVHGADAPAGPSLLLGRELRGL